jgi:putative aminopeptidase FrvX
LEQLDFSLLKTLCAIPAPSGAEAPLTAFLLSYIQQAKWKTTPQIFHGEGFQDCIVMVFGKPRTAIFAHLDSVGFMVGYQNELVKIGGPRMKNGFMLVGHDKNGPIECELQTSEEEGAKAFAQFEREIERGTTLTFACDFRESSESIQSCYLDNRLGCWMALQAAANLTDGIVCFSCWEEHGGGSVPFLAKFIYEQYGVKQALIADITWVTAGIKHGKGPVISLKDRAIPRKVYVDRIRKITEASGIPHQIEVEHAGGSDGIELQASPYPFDWCFIGPPESNVHTPDEKVSKKDVQLTLDLYKILMEQL